jgi:hypothetical protein
MPISKITVCLGLIPFAAMAGAQAPSPTVYTVTQAGSIPGAQTTFYRSGSKALIVNFTPVQGATPASKIYSLYDIAAGKNWTWNPEVKEVGCSIGSFSGDWGDPFAASADFLASIAKGEYKSAGTATMNGFATEIYTGSESGASIKVWFDRKDGLLIRAEASMPGGQPMVTTNVTKVSLAPPPMSLLNLPPICAGVKAPPTPEEKFADETGDNGSNYVSAYNGPGSAKTCQVILKAVDAKTMTPIPNVQVAIDTTYNQNDPNPPHYTYGVGNDGRMTFAGGGLHEITNTVHNGVVALNNLPSYFNLDVNVVEQPGRASSSGLVYRQCFAPRQVLLWVINDRGKSTESSDVLWVKSGKNAAPPTD